MGRESKVRSEQAVIRNPGEEFLGYLAVGPPVVGGQVPDGLGLIEQLVASLQEHLFYLGDLFDEPVGYGFVAQGHSLSAGISSRETEHRNSKCTLHALAPTIRGSKSSPRASGSHVWYKCQRWSTTKNNLKALPG
jgi:hypothetical protein